MTGKISSSVAHEVRASWRHLSEESQSLHEFLCGCGVQSFRRQVARSPEKAKLKSRAVQV